MSTATTGGPPPSQASAWWLAARPRTLPVALAPVLAGSALAWADTGHASPAVLAVAALVAVLIQVGTNLHNDVSDFMHGADDPGTRLGPRRATAEGWLTPARVRLVSYAVLALAFCLGLYLVWLVGWPVLALGVLSILAGLAYSGGPRPVAYTCLGELFVWIFFGLVAVGGTFYVQSGGMLTERALAAGAALGLPAAAVLVVNNTRDLENDRRAGRRTFPVVFGARASRIEYALMMLGAPPACAALLAKDHPGWAMLPLALLPWAWRLVADFREAGDGAGYNRLLARTAQFNLALAAIFCLGLLAGA